MMKRALLPLVAGVILISSACGGSGGRGPTPLPTLKALVRGTVQFTGELTAGAEAFMAIFPPGGGSAYQFYSIPQSDIDRGFHAFEFTGLDFGTYQLGVSVSFNPDPEDPEAQAPIRLLAPTSITLTQDEPAKQYDFTIEWPAPPAPAGSISGTVTLIGDFPADKSVWIAAIDATSPGPPKAQVEVTAEDVVGGEIPYTIPNVPYGSYIVTIFTYDFATHEADYFGGYDGAVVINEVTPSATGVDFVGDTSELE